MVFYSFYCPHCGFNFRDTNKEDVKAVRDFHQGRIPIKVRHCSLAQLSDGSFCRSELKSSLEVRLKEKSSD